MHTRKRPVISNYGLPVLSVGAVLIIGRWLDLHLHAAPVSLFICAVAVSAWFGGFRPGLLAMVLSILAFKYYFVPPIYSLVLGTAEIPRLIVFSLAALFVGSLSARQRNATEALRESEQRFRDYAEAAKAWLWETGPDHAFTQVGDHHARHRSRRPDRREAMGHRHRRRGRAREVAPACRDARSTPAVSRLRLPDRERRRIGGLHFHERQAPV